jgi:hypothetical protein
MFNLEEKIAEWRNQMLAAGIRTPAPLEELEIHLREDIERQLQPGLTERNAFEVSARQIGQPELLKSEFKKSERDGMKRSLIISAGIIGVLVGMAFVMPAVAQYRHEGAMTLNKICLLLLGFGLTLGGGSVAVFTFRKRKA